MKRNKKGFTLVELVIVIAVVAILAGVMIAVFSGVVRRAEESAKLQEMKNAEIASKADDILKKIDNAKWFGWEDLETKIGETITKTINGLDLSSNSSVAADELKTAVAAAVDTAIAKYAVAQGTENTALTAEQVKFIVEQAVASKGGVTETQVRSIVNTAVAGLATPLTKTQVQAVVDAAVAKVEAKQLTAQDLATALKDVATVDDVTTAINNATATVSTLTADEVEAIVAKYVTANGLAKGDFTWYDSEETALTITAEKATDSVIAVSTLTAAGESFKGKTITIEKVNNTTPATITLTEDWNPIKTFAGILEGNNATVEGVKFDVVYYSTEEQQSTGTSGYLGANSDGSWYGDKTGFGFINNLAEGGKISNLTVSYDMTAEDWGKDPECKYTYFGGIIGIAQDGTTIENCHVSGKIYSWGRTGGIVGGVLNGAHVTIKDCTFTGEIHARVSKHANNNVDTGVGNQYATAGGILGYADGYIASLGTEGAYVTLDGCTVSNAKLGVYDKDGELQTRAQNGAPKVCSMIGYVITASGQQRLWKGATACSETNVTYLNATHDVVTAYGSGLGWDATKVTTLPDAPQS